EGITYREEFHDQTGVQEAVIIETPDKTKNPAVTVKDTSPLLQDLTGNTYNLPVAPRLVVKNVSRVIAGEPLAQIPRIVGRTRDITGGLPRVTELFEARNPSSPATVTEIDGVVSYGGIKRGNREILIESKDGTQRRYLVPLSKHILV